ncbi:transcription antitermination factor NusB [Aquisalimonas sp.]|uniref:transcription antitermination factor NusB n=1 Tax=unclassified Aquisalimonas TaxID=2644645 RepID=UPI0025BB7D8C|nr:transcription antitermination factor NusB [Aquisalimonas sp.]
MARTRNRQNDNRQRRAARQRALQALYQWQLTGQSARDIEGQFLPAEDDQPPPERPPAVEPDRELEEALDMADTDLELFRELLHGVLERMEEWDAQITPHLDRAMASLDPVERLVLRMGAYELNERLDIPYRVVINEAVELAKCFGAEASHKYINGVLDKVARGQTMRAAEIERPRGRR